jgi:hypothetical protein
VYSVREQRFISMQRSRRARPLCAPIFLLKLVEKVETLHFDSFVDWLFSVAILDLNM